MKIIVYAICKNESKYIKKWYESMKEADDIYVLDTGSTDNSLELLKECGIKYKQQIINPWRFDVARNISLEMVPKDADLCVCTDLDEILNKGWRKILEEEYKGSLRVKYRFNWSLNDKDEPQVTYIHEKIHSRNNYKWKYPVHEVLEYTGTNETIEYNNKIYINHYPSKKSTRSNYLPLLELSLKEFPNDPRSYHYLGREYTYYKKYDKAIKVLSKHLKMKNSNWKNERSASLRYISYCYIAKGDYQKALESALKAIAEEPNTRENYFYVGYIYYLMKDYYKSKYYLKLSLTIPEINLNYISEGYVKDGTIEDLIGICEYNLNNIYSAIKYVNLAISKNKQNIRFKNNRELYLKSI